MPPPETPWAVVAPEPMRVAGVPFWEFSHRAFRVRFAGVGSPERDATLSARLPDLAPGADAAAWLRQRHGDHVVEASAGDCGEADALVVRTARLAAVVATADCVPVAVVGRATGAAIHAGWRGVVAGVVPRALARLRAEGENDLVAWIGPAIGGCCYEVGDEVAAAVTLASDAGALVQGASGRPRLDLRVAVASQLAAAGVARTTLVDVCTRCRPDLLWSHRREGERAGRNLTLLWRAGD